MSTMRPLPLEAGTPSDEPLFTEDAYVPKPRALDSRVVAPAAPRNFRRENGLNILSIIVLLRYCAIGTGPPFRAGSSPKKFNRIGLNATCTCRFGGWWNRLVRMRRFVRES